MDLDVDVSQISEKLENHKEEAQKEEKDLSEAEEMLNNLLLRTYNAGYNEAEMKAKEDNTELIVMALNAVVSVVVLALIYNQFYM